MNFKHLRNVQESIDGMKKIFSISWSPNLMRLAVAHVDEKRNVRISLFDENGERKETFPTRAANKSNKSYVVRDLAFSPDSNKLAISQSDNIVFVYNLGSNWGDKKTICNKFEQNSQVTTMIWPINRANELYFGVAEGKVKLGMLKSNSAQILYSTDSYVVTMCSSPDAKYFYSGHVDFSVYRYNIETGVSIKFINFSSVPYCLSCGVKNEILVAGNDYKIIIYSDSGDKSQIFDYTNKDDKLKDFTLSRINTSFDTIAVGNFDKYFIFMYNWKKNQWEEVCVKYIENYYTVTALFWKPDVNILVTGSLCGSIDIFESCLKKSLYGEKYEITYISHYQVMIKNLDNGKRVTLKSNLCNEILKLTIQNENYVIINTKESLLVADLNSGKGSEILNNFTGSEKYDFSNANVCMVYQMGEIIILEYGNNEIVGYCRTEYVHPNLISARIVNEDSYQCKVIAYLIDPYTIYIQDLLTQNIILNLTHDTNIEFLDLNKNGTKLLFRDNKRHLYLLLISENRKVTLLNFCGFVQWVPGAEVLVAQDRKNMIVWYNIDDLDNFKIIGIKGDIEEVRRVNDRTEVITDEGAGPTTFLLEENLINLSIAIEQGDLTTAVTILESITVASSSETDVYWKALSKTALNKKNLLITQRCFAALGAYSKASYIKKIMKDVETIGKDHPIVEAKLLILDKQFVNAETVLLKNNLVTEAIAIFNDVHRYEDSVKIAEKYNIPEYREIYTKYYNWLIENELFDKAAESKIKEGNLIDAIKLYIQGDFYIKAANLITREKVKIESNIIDFLVSSMIDIGIYEKAAELLEYTKDYEKCLDMYIKANLFPKAMEITKNHIIIKKDGLRNVKYTPIERIEELWGDYLTSQRKIEQSVSHYLDAGRLDKAIEALIASRKWDQAAELCDEQNKQGDSFKKDKKYNLNVFEYYKQIGDHYLKEKNFDLAEAYYKKSADYSSLIDIYIRMKKWEKLELLIESGEKEKIKEILIDLATKNEKESKFKEAEKLFIYAGEPDLAITMYKNIHNYIDMIRLVTVYMPDYLNASYLMIAQLYEEEKKFKEAEKYYTSSSSDNAWKSALDMYYRNNMIHECLRVADLWANSIDEFINICLQIFKENPIKGKEMLIELNMIENCIKFLCSSGVQNFEEAIKLAQTNNKELLTYVYSRYAIELKNNEIFEKAEECFIFSNQPRKALNMYLEMNDFNNALRIGRKYCEDMIPDIYYKQGDFFIKRNEFDKAEFCMVKANRPEIIFELLIDRNKSEGAILFAEKYAPHLIQKTIDNTNNILRVSENISDLKTKTAISNCVKFENSKNYYEAIELYLQIPQHEVKNKSSSLLIYAKVVELAKLTDKEYKRKVYEELIKRYLSLDEYRKGAELAKNIGDYEQAITLYVMAGETKEADQMVMQSNETDKEYLLTILNKKINSNNSDNFDDLISEGRYEECLNKLKDMESDLFNKYFIKIASVYFNNKQYLELCLLTLRLDPVFNNKTINILKTLSLEILAEENVEELENLKSIFEKKEDNYLSILESKVELERMHKITHYQLLKFFAFEKKLNELYYCLSVSVLQYGDIIKLDLALLDAVKISNKLKFNGNAYVYTNAYLDLFEFIQYGGDIEDNSELKSANVSPKDAYLSANNIISLGEKEELNKWIVAKSVDKAFEKSLIKVQCVACKSDLFETSLYCANCNYTYDQCIVSGFPIRENNPVRCNGCNKKSIVKYWKEWIKVFHYCPWCRAIYK